MVENPEQSRYCDGDEISLMPLFRYLEREGEISDEPESGNLTVCKKILFARKGGKNANKNLKIEV